jgi:DNA mismatch repair protein MutS
MQQHAQAKAAHPDAIIFFRLGDFYEMFGEDAVVASKLLELVLTSRNRGKPDEVPMCGVPYHAAHGYVAKLLELGHKVALCEQMADPAKTKGIVPREVVRVLTPALVTDADQLEARRNNWLAAVDVTERASGLALLDLSTGELRAASVPNAAMLLAELSRAAPREVLLGLAPGVTLDDRAVKLAAPRAISRPDAELSEAREREELGELAPEAGALAASARRAVARALRYARACHPLTELPVRSVGAWDPAESMFIDATAQTHLELVQAGSGEKRATLLAVVDATCTAGGGRLLRRRLLSPLLDVERIRRRLDAVEFFVVNSRLRSELRVALDGVGDLERLGMRASLREATPRDLGALRDGLHNAARALALLKPVSDASDREVLGLDAADAFDTVHELAEELSRALVERPPAQPKDGGLFLKGYDAELDELDGLRQSGTERMVELEARLKQETGIPTLKIRYTRVFGWYVEVTRSHAARVPGKFRRKQTVATGERYTTDEVDALAERITTAEDRHRERELALLAELVEHAAARAERVRRLAARLARLDVAQGLAETAHRHDFARPVVDGSDILEITEGRHPVVERLVAAGRFVPNDVKLDAGGEHLWLVTGPNMAGKSTLLRQVALTTILAQMGSYVPARAARVGVVDRVLSRVGASDNLAGGESTFMVEMRETAHILRTATRRSLVILDEIGRGTSTFDGLAIAWAVAEFLDEAIGCRALFATHYHELTALADSSAGVANYSVSAKELGEDVVFLHRLVPGATSRSYGVAVAKLAGLPESVLGRARAVLGSLEGGSPRSSEGELPAPKKRRRAPTNQLELFQTPADSSPALQEVAATIRALEIERLTPLEALGLLARLKTQLS